MANWQNYGQVKELQRKKIRIYEEGRDSVQTKLKGQNKKNGAYFRLKTSQGY